MRLLDLAGGTGEAAIGLAARVGKRAAGTALDLSLEMLAIAERRAQARGLTSLSTQSADAHALAFPDDHLL